MASFSSTQRTRRRRRTAPLRTLRTTALSQFLSRLQNFQPYHLDFRSAKTEFRNYRHRKPIDSLRYSQTSDSNAKTTRLRTQSYALRTLRPDRFPMSVVFVFFFETSKGRASFLPPTLYVPAGWCRERQNRQRISPCTEYYVLREYRYAYLYKAYLHTITMLVVSRTHRSILQADIHWRTNAAAEADVSTSSCGLLYDPNEKIRALHYNTRTTILRFDVSNGQRPPLGTGVVVENDCRDDPAVNSHTHSRPVRSFVFHRRILVDAIYHQTIVLV